MSRCSSTVFTVKGRVGLVDDGSTFFTPQTLIISGAWPPPAPSLYKYHIICICTCIKLSKIICIDTVHTYRKAQVQYSIFPQSCTRQTTFYSLSLLLTGVGMGNVLYFHVKPVVCMDCSIFESRNSVFHKSRFIQGISVYINLHKCNLISF